MLDKKIVIAIDGPAASGKSTTARRVAERLGYTYIDSGAMYRAATLAVERAGVDPHDRDAVEELARTLVIDFEWDAASGTLRTLLDGRDVSKEIRLPEVTAQVSLVSSYAGVRRQLVTLQKRMGERGGVVLDGRDIGTVVFPDADVKVFMVADIGARAERRQKELHELGSEVSVAGLREQIAERDRFDSSREVSPLRKADDAVEIDTSGLTIDQQVDRVIELVRERVKGEG